MSYHKHTQDEKDFASHQKKEQWAKVKVWARMLGVTNLDCYANISLLQKMEKEGRRIDRRILDTPLWVKHKGTSKNKRLGSAEEKIAGMDLKRLGTKHYEFVMVNPPLPEPIPTPALRRLIQKETITETINLDPLAQEDLVDLNDVKKVLEIIRMCGSEESALRVMALALKMLEVIDE